MKKAMQTRGDATRKRVYLDYVATTPLDARVLEAMEPYLTTCYGNANSLYREGREAFRALENARTQVAELLGAKEPSEIIFTSGGTEGDNAALLGIMGAVTQNNRHARLVVSRFEHHAVLHTAQRLVSLGHELAYLTPHASGFVAPNDLEALLHTQAVNANGVADANGSKIKTVLVSVMMANNEVGTVQPIEELTRVAHEADALFHTDAVQALGKCDIALNALGVDAASFSGHKIYGPKGTGVLYLRRRTPFATQMLGGGQEQGFRSGTQNVAGAVGFARALELACVQRIDEHVRLKELQMRLLDALVGISSRVHLTVDPRDEAPNGCGYLPNMLNVFIDGVESETMLLRLDEAGFSVSAGSACSSTSLEPSHVLAALGIPAHKAYGALRISLGRDTTLADVDAFIESFAAILVEI